MSVEEGTHSAIYSSHDDTYVVAWDSRCEICMKGYVHIDVMDNANKEDITKLNVHLF